MKKIKLAIIREGKIPVDKRAPFSPVQAMEIMQKFLHVTVVAQKSSIRCFSNEEYEKQGVQLVHDVSDCDILMGIKEVPISSLIENKTYLFFSHTMKKQPYNRGLLQAILKKNITLIDYEALRDVNGKRLVAFGRYAGIVGTYNCLWMYGNRYELFSLKRAMECYDYDDLKNEFSKIKLPPVRNILTGTGRVGKGAEEVLQRVGVKKITVNEFLTESYDEPVYVQLSSEDYYQHKDGKSFDREEFYENPQNHKSDFLKYAHRGDILINGTYWKQESPRLFTKEDMLDATFRIKVIADISCDINGSVPATIKSTDVYNPVYDYDPFTHSAKPAFSDEKFISMMAVDNLPCELPRNASVDFGRDLIEHVLQLLLNNENNNIIKKGTITSDGKLKSHFDYLENYVNGTTE
jgi:alanine dehydrogenase